MTLYLRLFSTLSAALLRARLFVNVYVYLYLWFHGDIYCTMTLIRVHISFKVCFQFQYVAAVHTDPMKSKHIITKNHVWFRITSQCVEFCCNAHFLDITVYIFVSSERDWLSFDFFLHIRVFQLFFFISKPMQKHTCIVLLQFKACFIIFDYRYGASIKKRKKEKISKIIETLPDPERLWKEKDMKWECVVLPARCTIWDYRTISPKKQTIHYKKKDIFPKGCACVIFV